MARHGASRSTIQTPIHRPPPTPPAPTYDAAKLEAIREDAEAAAVVRQHAREREDEARAVWIGAKQHRETLERQQASERDIARAARQEADAKAKFDRAADATRRATERMKSMRALVRNLDAYIGRHGPAGGPRITNAEAPAA